jgi:ATP-dependent protease ClpP protease subunit
MKDMNKDILKLLQGDKEPFAVFSAPISQVHRVTIDEEFRDVSQFAELVDTLETAQEGDVVQIRLSTVGGALHAIIPLINAMKHTEAFIHVHVESDTASAGTMIMALAHNLYVNEYATIMYHNVQYGAFGHGGNVEAQVKHITSGSKKLIRDVYEGLLTPNEIARLEDGLELYMTGEECMDRFFARQQARQGACQCGECDVVEDKPVKKARKPRAKRIKVEEAPAQQQFVE